MPLWWVRKQVGLLFYIHESKYEVWENDYAILLSYKPFYSKDIIYSREEAIMNKVSFDNCPKNYLLVDRINVSKIFQLL